MKFEIITDQLQFPEGPVAMNDGSVLVVEIKAQRMTRVRPDGSLEVIAELGGGPNGIAIGPDGAAYVCNNGGHLWPQRDDGLMLMHGIPDDYEGGSIQRVDLKSGEVRTLYTHCGNVRLKGPNDIVFDNQGGFWFTDLGKIGEEQICEWGVIYYATIDGSWIARQRGGLITPNGIGLSPDQKTIYVAETLTGRAWAFALVSPGEMEPEPTQAWSSSPMLGQVQGYDIFDSLGVEADGRICVATVLKGGITCFEPDGGSEFYKMPEAYVTNICFGGADMRDAWITASATGKLLKTRWPRPGLKLAFNV